MILQDLSLMYTAGHSENFKKFPIKHNAVSFSGFALKSYLLQYFVLFYSYSKSKITAVVQSSEFFLRKNIFRTTVLCNRYLSREETIRICQLHKYK